MDIDMCVCGNEISFDMCCGSILDGSRKAQTPEELMRSRFSAYVRANGKYLVQSTVLENQHEDDATIIQDFSNSVEWLRLDVICAQSDTVEFKAYYKDDEKIHLLHEKSNFVQEDDVWKYKDGDLYNSKIERNISCPCGSGKKFKKCCS